MIDDLEQFANAVIDSGVLNANELSDFRDTLAEPPQDAQDLARQLVDGKLLTGFQARVIYNGTGGNLTLGGYVILDRAGAGGMGRVFRARHRRMKRIVAVKMLPSDSMKSPEAVRRFEREVEAAAKLSHPNIVTAYDADAVNGVHYLVMEYVDGHELTPLVDAPPAPVALIVDYMIQAARGLDYAHAHGVVHRDIKPSNLLLSGEGVVKILDMGMARFDELLDKNAAAGLTQTGQIMGTVDYMSPEQAEDARQADGRSDIYSLGCTMYCLFTKQPPYSGETAIQTLIAHREQPIPRIRQLRPDAPESLEAVFQKMVAKRREQRYQSMAQVIEALSGISTAPVPPQPAAPPRRVDKYDNNFEFRLADDADDGMLGSAVLTDADKPRRVTAANRKTTISELQIEISCKCGQRFAADRSLAGKKVACPKCHQALHIPPQAEPLEVTCECGRRFAVRADLHGASVSCPGCGETLKIPQASARKLVEVRCACGQRFAADAKLAGRTFNCTKCGKSLTMPP